MKKTLVFIALSTVVFTVLAQDSKFNIGVEFAAIRTHLWGEDFYNINPLYSISPGLNLEYLLNPNLSIKTGLIYERKGWKSIVYFSDIDTKSTGAPNYTRQSDYLTIPVLLSLSTKGPVSFYVSGGAYFGYLLSSKVIISETLVRPEWIIDSKENTKDFDFGLSFGCGVTIPVGNRFAFDVGLRDNLGLIDGKGGFNTLGLVISLKYRL